MLTEVPPELAELQDFKSMISLYVEQLRILSEMRATITELFTSGHFEFQEDFARSFPASTPSAELATEAARLAAINTVLSHPIFEWSHSSFPCRTGLIKWCLLVASTTS